MILLIKIKPNFEMMYEVNDYTDVITSQSHSLFACSREQIRQVENRLKSFSCFLQDKEFSRSYMLNDTKRFISRRNVIRSIPAAGLKAFSSNSKLMSSPNSGSKTKNIYITALQ